MSRRRQAPVSGQASFGFVEAEAPPMQAPSVDAPAPRAAVILAPRTLPRQPRYRPVPIATFCDEVMQIYGAPTKERYSTFSRVRRVFVFLDKHPSVKTTADLTESIIPEFANACGGIRESTLKSYLRGLQRICNLAVKWGYLKRNPCDAYPLDRLAPRTSAKGRGRELSSDHIKRILEYLKSATDTWAGHRVYVFVALVVYTGLRSGEALELKCENVDLARRVIEVPRRMKLRFSPHPKAVNIGDELMPILAAWLPERMQGPRAWNRQIPYGFKRAADGRTLIPDDAEREVVDKMIRWRADGWRIYQIVAKLNAQGVPTKRGRAKWEDGTVLRILEREARPDPRDVAEAGSAWLFPNDTGAGHWYTTNACRYTALQQLRAAGNALGIEGLTIESLSRYFHEHARPVLPLKSTGQVAERSDAETPSVPAAWPWSEWEWSELVKLGADRVPIVLGNIMKPLTKTQSLVVKALLAAGRKGLNRAEIDSVCGDARKVLGRMKQSDPLWARVLHFPGKRGADTYRIGFPAPDI